MTNNPFARVRPAFRGESLKVDKAVKPSKDSDKIHDKDDVDSSETAHHHTLGKGAYQAAPGNHTHDASSAPVVLDPNTSATVGASSPFGGNMYFVKTPTGLIIARGAITRASGFSATYTAVCTIPAGFVPAAVFQTELQPFVYFASTAKYQFRINAGVIELKMSAAAAGIVMSFAHAWTESI